MFRGKLALICGLIDQIFDDAKGKGVTVATSCPACMMQISDMLARQNARIRVKHPVQIYAEQLKGVVG